MRLARRNKVPAYIKNSERWRSPSLMGFDTVSTKNYDPRAKIIIWTASRFFEVTGRNPKLEDRLLSWSASRSKTSILCEAQTLSECRFLFRESVTRPWDFRPEMFTVLFAISTHRRMAGTVAGVDHRSGTKDSRPRRYYHGFMKSGNLWQWRSVTSGAFGEGLAAKIFYLSLHMAETRLRISSR